MKLNFTDLAQFIHAYKHPLVHILFPTSHTLANEFEHLSILEVFTEIERTLITPTRPTTCA